MCEKRSSLNRSSYWDNIKGTLILLVVFGHVLMEQTAGGDTARQTVRYIYMFHMPAFVFVSGFFGKSERSRSFESILRLVFLYFVFNSLMGFWRGFGTQTLLTPLVSYWYLPALIAWRVSAHRLANAKHILAILFAVAVFIGFLPGIDNTLAATRILAYYPFYMAGFLLPQEKADAILKMHPARRIAAGIAAIAAAGFGMWIAERHLAVPELTCKPYGEAAEAIGRIAVFAISALATFALCLLSADRRIPLLTAFGRNSLWIFLLHRPATMVASRWFCRGTVATAMAGAVALTLLITIAFGNRWIVLPLNRWADQGGRLLTETDVRKTWAARVSVLAVALGFVIKIVFSAHAG